MTANKQLLSQHGEELFETAREHDVRLRFEAAVGGRRAGRARARGIALGDADRAHPRDRQRHDQLHPHRDERAARATPRRSPRPSASATPRPTRATTSPAATPRRRWRSSRGSRSARPCTSTTSATRASSTCTPTISQYARELGLGLKLVGTAERRQGGLSVRVYPTFLYSGHPLASISGSFNAVTVESDDDHRDHALRPRRRRAPDRERGARRRRQRDDRRRAAAGAAARAAADRGRRERLLPAPRRRGPAGRAGDRHAGARRAARSRSSRSCSAGWASMRGW